MNNNTELVFGLTLMLFFPALIALTGAPRMPMIDVPEEYDAWLYVEYGVSSNPERYTHVELDEFKHLPYLQMMLREGETPINHVMMEYNGVEARRAVYYLSQVKGLEDRRHLDDMDRVLYVYAVEAEGRHTHIIIVFGETRPVMA